MQRRSKSLDVFSRLAPKVILKADDRPCSMQKSAGYNGIYRLHRTHPFDALVFVCSSALNPLLHWSTFSRMSPIVHLFHPVYEARTQQFVAPISASGDLFSSAEVRVVKTHVSLPRCSPTCGHPLLPPITVVQRLHTEPLDLALPSSPASVPASMLQSPGLGSAPGPFKSSKRLLHQCKPQNELGKPD